MRTYKPHKCRSKEQQARINAEVAKRKAKLAEKYNTDTQYYKGITVELIVREEYGCYKAKRFKINNSNQNVWIPNCYLEDDGTIKANMNIDFLFRKSVNQLNKEGITKAIIGIKRKTPEADVQNLKSTMQKSQIQEELYGCNNQMQKDWA